MAGLLAAGALVVLGVVGMEQAYRSISWTTVILVLALVLLTVVLGQLISNTATALIVIPIAVTAAGDAGISARPVLMAVAVAAAASFLTPVATPPTSW